MGEGHPFCELKIMLMLVRSVAPLAPSNSGTRNTNPISKHPNFKRRKKTYLPPPPSIGFNIREKKEMSINFLS